MIFPFNSKGYVRDNLQLGAGYCHFLDLEDFWEDCENDYEVRK